MWCCADWSAYDLKQCIADIIFSDLRWCRCNITMMYAIKWERFESSRYGSFFTVSPQWLYKLCWRHSCYASGKIQRWHQWRVFCLFIILNTVAVEVKLSSLFSMSVCFIFAHSFVFVLAMFSLCHTHSFNPCLVILLTCSLCVFISFYCALFTSCSCHMYLLCATYCCHRCPLLASGVWLQVRFHLPFLIQWNLYLSLESHT